MRIKGSGVGGRISGATALLLCMTAGVLAAARVQAAEIEPRAYMNAPVGMNFLIMGYVYTDGGISTEASSPLQDAKLYINTGLLAYARAMDFWGKSGKIDIILPVSDLSGNALVNGQPRERHISGLNDPRFRVSVNFLGAPALSKQEFAGYKQDLIVGASLQVSPPLGQYDPDRLINLGTNRWYFKPEFGVSKALGPFTLELAAAAFLFTDNDDYFGGRTLEQDPVYSGQAHLIYSLGRGLWAAVHGAYDWGGRTTTNGVEDDNELNNTRLGATLAVPVNANNSVKIYGSTGTSTRTGTDYDLIGIGWQVRW